MLWLIGILLTTAITLVLYSRLFSRNDVPTLQGPPTDSWLYGNMLDLLLQVPYEEFEEKCQHLYGRVYRVKACFGQDRLMITDSAALRYVASNSSLFIRPRQFRMLIQIWFGKGSLMSKDGNDHQRLRNVMNPAFSGPNMRAIIPTLTKVAGDLVDRLLSQCQDQGTSCIVDMYRQFHDTSLQAVGEGIMGYNFASDEAFKKCYENLMVSSSKKTKSAILMDSTIPYFPGWLIMLMTYFPPKGLQRLLEQRSLAEKIADTMVKNKLEMKKVVGLTADKDLFSTIVEINSKAAKPMTFEELKDRFGSLNAVGEDTTGNTLCWGLYELAKNPEWQETLRNELAQAQQSTARGRVDYKKLPFLNAFIKETLRFYPAGPQTSRVADKDTVIPLATPVTTTKGKTINEIYVKRGQSIVIHIQSYHRLPELWGTDANVFRPSRWLDGKGQLGDGVAVGPYSNLLAFWGGPYTCMGWRFSILETQIILSELIKTFSFSIDASSSPTYPTIALTLAPSDGKGNFELKLRVSALI